jgi:D-arabinose 1-dehydrogenase-like Zn-dependent alcohol dehydrogenase
MATVPFQDWIDLCAKGAMKTNLDKTFKLEEAPEAHEYMEANKVRPLPLSRIPWYLKADLI